MWENINGKSNAYQTWLSLNKEADDKYKEKKT
jgi:hypothetical protein